MYTVTTDERGVFGVAKDGAPIPGIMMDDVALAEALVEALSAPDPDLTAIAGKGRGPEGHHYIDAGTLRACMAIAQWAGSTAS